MWVCDEESDGYGVHGDFDFHYQGQRLRLDESGGADSSCDSKNAGSWGVWGLWRHRTVEERPAWNDLDEKGAWDYRH